MSREAGANAEKRVPLSRERVLRGAFAVAEAAGIGSLTMRSLAQALGVKPMSLYHHVANKEAILDGIIDVVFSEIDLPPADADWRSAMRHRAISARRVLARHPWAIPLMESRTTPGPATRVRARPTPRQSRQAPELRLSAWPAARSERRRGRQLL